MSLLEEFIFTLSKSESQMLRPLQFRGVKRRILLKILGCRDRSGLNAAAIMRSYKLTRQRYNQILSEILAACYRDIAPQGGIDLIQFLGNKQLFKHVLYEMRRQEAALMSLERMKLLESYYVQSIIISECFMVPPKGNEKALAEGRDYVRRYVAVKTPSPDDLLFIALEDIDAKIGDSIATSFEVENVCRYIEALEDIYQRAESVLLRFLLHSRLYRHYLRLASNVEKAHEHFLGAKAIMDEHASLFGRIRDLFELGYELEVAAKEHREFNLNEHKKYFSDKLIWHNGLPLNYMHIFFPMLLKTGDFKLARTYIRQYFPQNIALLRNDIAIYYWRLLMLHEIYAGNDRQAEIYMRNAFAANRGKTRNIRFDILLRPYEVYFAAMNHNPIHAEELASKHLRYSQQHQYYDNDFLKTVGELMRLAGKADQRSAAVYSAYTQSVRQISHFALLSKRIYAKFFERAVAEAGEPLAR